MRLVIFGASGRTGQELVSQALERGHQVRAFARTPDKITVQHERLEVVAGDVQDAEAVQQAVDGRDAVMSVLGPTRNLPDPQVTRGTRNIVATMQRCGVRRLIVTAGAGVEDPRDHPSIVNRIVKLLLLLLARHVYEDMRGTVEVVRSSDLDWTVVRVPRLTDAPASGTIRADYLGGDVGIQIGRADVATFLLDQLESDQHLRAAPVISS